ncbi:MAG: helix-turn-helix domain-containing protein [Candidatus Jordarchaeaceae archaeon]
MERKEIVEMFKNFGLSDYEAKTYVSLLFLGPSKVSDISRDSKVPQSKMYEVLERLLAKQLVEVYGITPKEFRAINPNVAFKTLLEEKEKQIMEIKEKINILKDVIKQNGKDEVLEGVWTTKENGWKSFMNKVCDMIERSNKYVYIVTRDFSWSYRLGKLIKSSFRRGVEIRIISIREIDDTIYQRAKWMHDHGAKIRIYHTNIHPRIINSDGKEILLRLDSNPVDRDSFYFTSIWSKEASLVRVIDTYLKSLWNNGKPVNFKRISER